MMVMDRLVPFSRSDSTPGPDATAKFSPGQGHLRWLSPSVKSLVYSCTNRIEPGSAAPVTGTVMAGVTGTVMAAVTQSVTAAVTAPQPAPGEPPGEHPDGAPVLGEIPDDAEPPSVLLAGQGAGG